jgi:hypothetical protein
MLEQYILIFLWVCKRSHPTNFRSWCCWGGNSSQTTVCIKNPQCTSYLCKRGGSTRLLHGGLYSCRNGSRVVILEAGATNQRCWRCRARCNRETFDNPNMARRGTLSYRGNCLNVIYIFSQSCTRSWKGSLRSSGTIDRKYRERAIQVLRGGGSTALSNIASNAGGDGGRALRVCTPLRQGQVIVRC